MKFGGEDAPLVAAFQRDGRGKLSPRQPVDALEMFSTAAQHAERDQTRKERGQHNRDPADSHSAAPQVGCKLTRTKSRGNPTRTSPSGAVADFERQGHFIDGGGAIDHFKLPQRTACIRFEYLVAELT